MDECGIGAQDGVCTRHVPLDTIDTPAGKAVDGSHTHPDGLERQTDYCLDTATFHFYSYRH